MVERNWRMNVSRRMFNRAAVTALVMLSVWTADGAVGESAGDAFEPLVLARVTSVVLAARETHVALLPVPVRRRPPAKAKPKKGAKPVPPRTQLLLRDVVLRAGAPGYDVFLVLEGLNVFQATETRVQVGTLEQSGAPETADKPMTVAFEANDAFAKFAKIRGFNIRHLRVAIVRRAVKDKKDEESQPADRPHPEIGAIELVRS
jgi:hypothetical protein